jgi:indolepyruvate ferredoxin oxidoreductase
LIKHYEQLIDRLLPLLNDENYILMLQLVSLPEEIRGYGHVKEEHLKGVKLREEKLMAHIFDPAADKELSQSAEGHLRHAS